MTRIPVTYLQVLLILAIVFVPPAAAWAGIKVVNELPDDPIPPGFRPGDRAALLAYARSLGIPDGEVATLQRVLAEDEAPPGQYGSGVADWLKSIAESNLKLASAEADDKRTELRAKAITRSFYLTEAVARYHRQDA